MKRRNFTLSVKNNIPEFIKEVEQCPNYAWIIHNKDTDKDKPAEPIEDHIHAYVEFPNPRSFASVAEILGVPENMVCKVIDKNGILQYLIHKNQPEKFQYGFDEIHSNFDLTPFFMDKSTTTWSDFNKLRTGKLTSDEFYDIHKHEIDHSSFYQKLRIYQIIVDTRNTVAPPPLMPPIHGLIKD